MKKRVGEWALSMVWVEEGREFRFRGDLYSQESTFPLVKTAISIMVISNRNTTADLKCPASSRSNCTTPRSLVHWSASAPAAIDRYLLYTPPALSSKPTGRRCCCRLVGQTDGRMDGRTDSRPLHICPASHTMYAARAFCTQLLCF